MEILNVNMSIDPVRGGGTAERTVQMSKALAEGGNECLLITLDIGVTAERMQALVGVKTILLHCLFKRFYVPYPNLRVIYKTVQESDIVHIMGYRTIINVWIYWIAMWLKKKYVVCPAGELTLFGRSLFLKRVFNSLVGRSMIRNASACIAVTKDEIVHFENYGVPSNKMVIIPNGIQEIDFVDENVAEFRLEYGLANHPYLLFVGRLNLIKGPDLLMQAFAEALELKGHHLVFVGPDQGMKHTLTAMAINAGIQDRVHFLGYLGGRNKSRAYHGAELLVIPSRHEAMSIVVLEAGICGTPVLLTDQCGFDELEDINGGRVVNVNVEAIKLAMIELLKEPDQLKKMGLNLQRFVTDNYKWNKIAEQYIALYKSVLNEARWSDGSDAEDM